MILSKKLEENSFKKLSQELLQLKTIILVISLLMKKEKIKIIFLLDKWMKNNLMRLLSNKH